MINVALGAGDIMKHGCVRLDMCFKELAYSPFAISAKAKSQHLGPSDFPIDGTHNECGNGSHREYPRLPWQMSNVSYPLPNGHHGKGQGKEHRQDKVVVHEVTQGVIPRLTWDIQRTILEW
jgi:hypothetical protein